VAAHHHLRDRRLRAHGRCARSRSAASSASAITCPFAFGVAIFAYVTLVVIRPVLLGAWGHGFPVRDHEPPRLGVEHRLPVPALPLQPGAHDRGHVLLSTTFALSLHGSLILSATNPPRAARRSRRPSTRTPSSATPSAIRSARWASTAWACSWRCRGLLERGLHRHQRPVLDARLARMVGWWLNLPIWRRREPLASPKRRTTWLNIRTSSRACRSRTARVTRRAAPLRQQGARRPAQGSHPPAGPGRSATRRSARSTSAGSALASLICGFIAIEIIGLNMLASVNWDPIQFVRSCPGWRSSRRRPKYGLRYPAAERGRLVADGRLLPDASILLWWVRMYRRARRWAWARMSPGPLPRRSGSTWCWASSARC
jgi:hypothetical protein